MFVGVGQVRKPAEYREARRLRHEYGMPFKRIAAAVGVSVASAHAWTRDIEITPEQKRRNLFGPRGPQSPEHVRRRVEAWKQTNRDKRRHYQDEGRAKARQSDPLHLAGCMLYWAEGSKERNAVKLVNSDPEMVRFFRNFLTDCLGIAPTDLRVRLNVYLGNGLSISEIEQRWLQVLDLPRECLWAHTIDYLPTSSSGRKRNKLPYGVCELKLNSTRIVQPIYGAIQEYAGFEEPRWLDGPPRKRRPARATA